MRLRQTLLFVTALAGAVLLAGIGLLALGSPEQIAHLPSSGLLTAGVVLLAGMIYLQATKARAPVASSLKSTLATVGFAILVVTAVFLAGFFVTNH